MLVLEYKVKAKPSQYRAIDEAIQTVQFIRNKSIRYWMDASREDKIDRFALNKYSTKLRQEFAFVKELNAMAVQAAAERGWLSISRFYDNCKKKKPGKKGYPKFQRSNRSVEYKTSGWSLIPTKRRITFTDKKGIGELKLLGKWDIHTYPVVAIKRVRLVRRADGYYCQFCVDVECRDIQPLSGKEIGLDVGLESFYTDSNGYHEPNPKFLRKSEPDIKHAQRRIYKKQKGSNNRRQARARYSKKHLRVSRQRNEHAKRLARNVCKSNDLVAYEDLKISNMLKNHCLAKSIADASWYLFRMWIHYFATKFGKLAVAIPPHYTSAECSQCKRVVRKSLSARTHVCVCGCNLHRDTNAAINILLKAKSRGGHPQSNAGGVVTSTLLGATLVEQVATVNLESPHL
ncbi:MAG: transposase [Microcoleus sp. PH2017_29_MFU_D_A]|jgi:putative transposase|uniref:RNA-guided endonuclease InsQ/TnpB family protein n=1 Tax=unclassified Microcoleus TaxID=2642155 RepID=UPI001DBA7560|nr:MULTISPECIES: transposase [unclassified Microcoleus]MCC3420613.1 transposase [Microcoleus sp. PH2017_07_MST_O_A]MCC3429460.1 transposase [Microcoleus sp. PH2017_04_SCI_O_A]MCC3443719.1 transposase [Microcoleus sp. PH2017_03_ELD_O_A]MCC3466889.1 transposase [Microcoleus sp. PH2017_06_SFM_O_A]MCC3505692.1 transposase [Microcoleus sp. PH2017_19_SFW_U_A]MCC3511121.1 transposase [Microcoleus sp. PH2017_17_BER_D_A]TAE07330.1 MAG: transposase [Oscillatoriales cyanobacterium]